MRAFVVAVLLSIASLVQGVEPLEHGHVHEAFMNVESPITLLTAIPQKPPEPLNEVIPEQKDGRTVWVPGYWEWSMDLKEFVWCSGSWRVPPPDHQWIAGKWIKADAGWVRTKGFWSTKKESQLSYIQQSPPDVYDENPGKPQNKDDFWMSGYWQWNGSRYIWYSGKWEKLDRDWIYVPAKYVWREQGYVFVEPFWDWPLDERGTAYACVKVPSGQTSISYPPSLIVDTMTILDDCLLCYPNYYCFYYYYHFFYVDWWVGCAWCPPWWGWGADWWWFPWADQWALWWWWTHPGFFAPWWLDPFLINMMMGPPWPLINAMEDVHPPLIMGPNGMIPPANLLEQLDDGAPIFPMDPDDIQEDAGKDLPEGSTDRPGGEGGKPDERPQIPPNAPLGAPEADQPSVPETSDTPQTVTPPPKPSVPREPTPPTRPSTPSQPPTYQPSQPQYQPSRPQYQPSRPQYQPSQPQYRPRPRPQPQQRPQSRPDYTPQRPQYRPSIPQYRPSTPQTRPNIPQYRPSTPQTQPNTTPSQPGPSRPKGEFY